MPDIIGICPAYFWRSLRPRPGLPATSIYKADPDPTYSLPGLQGSLYRKKYFFEMVEENIRKQPYLSYQ